MRFASLVFAAIASALALSVAHAQTAEKTKPAAEATVKPPPTAAKPAPAKQLHDGLNPRLIQDGAKSKAGSPMRSMPADIDKSSDDCHHKGKASDA